jgi:hypothetical protein
VIIGKSALPLANGTTITLPTGRERLKAMLTSVKVDRDEDSVYVEIRGDSESENRSFWLTDLVLLEQVRGICLGARLDQIHKDWREEAAKETTEKKKAA